MGQAEVHISLEYLRDMLRFPQDAKILFVEQDIQARWGRYVQMLVESPDLPEVHEGERPRVVDPVYESMYFPKFRSWGWE
jgi:hypothetical protein